jgi:selenium-dependent xanthine dehydrogenase
MNSAPIRFRLNGEDVEVTPCPGESLLETLRTRCGVSSTKDGCQPQGQCGCCLTLVDGAAKVSCAMPAEKAAGKDIVTLEGLPDADRALLADSFVAAAGLQCGFCIPGIALRAYHLVGRNPEPSRDEIAKGIDVHLCRCTGYTKIIDAIELYARAKRGEALPAPHGGGRVGEPYRRYRSAELTLGDRPYVDDFVLPGMLHGAILQSAHPRARVRSIDTSAAEALPGVVRVATAADVPGDRWYGLIHSDWPGFVAIGEETRCVGDVLAAVAAVDEHTARAAVGAIVVDYEVLEPVLDPELALAPGAPQVNPAHDNQLSRTAFRRGDAAAALASSTHVVEGTWRTQRIEHLFLEPESAVATRRPDGALHLYTQGQGIFDDRRQVARFLGVHEDRVFVELVPNGGAFGGKEDMSIQAHTALLAHLTGKPVKITLTREESVRMHPKRHPITMHYRVGCDAEGHLTAVEARLVGDSGAYASVGEKVLERAAGHACGPYRTPAVDIEARAAYTNNPPCGAMRGFGVNQTSFAIEACMDALAAKVGIDKWEMRWRNAVEVGDLFSTGQVFEKSVGLKKTLEAVKAPFYEALAAGKAVGIGCGLKNTGLGNGAKEWGRARLAIEGPDSIAIYNGFTEMGQGLLTILVQFAVEVTGLPPEVFHPKVDSTFVLSCGQTTGSRATLLSGRAVKLAAEKLRADLDAGSTIEDLVGRVYHGDALIDDTTKPGQDGGRIKTHTAFGFATQVVVLDQDGRLERVVAAHDVGRAVNPALCEGQIEGSVHMGLGYALSEELPCEDGMPVTFKLREIGVLRARDMPPVDVILVEEHEPEGPFGAKGVGEIGLVPTAGAVAGAIEAFDGVRHHTLPMKESTPARHLSVGKIRAKSREHWH